MKVIESTSGGFGLIFFKAMQGTKNLPELMQIIEQSDFAAIGVADFVVLEQEREFFVDWLAKGMHGEMDYLQRSSEIRHDARNIFPEVQSVIVTLTEIHRVKPHVPTIAAFAHNFRDYHYQIKDKLHFLLKQLQEIDPDLKGRAVVDSAPIFEKAWAVRAGLGWIGRNSLLVNPEKGSYTLIGLLLVNRKVEFKSTILTDACPEGCTMCIDSCPNGAINDNRTINARKCISYLTMEVSLRGGLTHGHILGCDRCADICPFNKENIAIEPTLDVDWTEITQEEFKQRFRRSSFERVGLERIKSILASEQHEG